MLRVTVGLSRTLATATAAPLLRPNEVTTALRVAPARGSFFTATVRVFSVAQLTLPVAPPLSDTRLVRFTGSKPLPSIVNCFADLASNAVPGSTTGGAASAVA